MDSKINELCNSYVKMQRTHNFIFDQFQTVNISLLGWNKHLYFNPGVAKDKLTGEVYRIGGGEKKTSVNEDKNDFGNDGKTEIFF